MESGYDIRFRLQFLDGFAKSRFHFQVLLEIVVAELVVYFDDVIEHLAVCLVVLPQFADVFLRNGFHFFPSLLDVLEIII